MSIFLRKLGLGVLAALFATAALAQATYTTMYPPVGGPYKYLTLTLPQTGNRYNPLLGTQAVDDRDGLALLEDGWSYINPVSSGGGGGTPTYGTILTATLATTQSNYTTTGLAPGVWLKLAAASGGSTMTGLTSTGFTAGQTIIVTNTSTTDSIVFSNQSGSSQAGNQFLNANAAPASLAPGASTGVLWDGTYFRFY
jgi:hypothetical protein